jgi:hypothetical protein
MNRKENKRYEESFLSSIKIEGIKHTTTMTATNNIKIGDY